MKPTRPIGVFLILLVVSFIFLEILLQSKVAVPADTLVGAYFPWLDYKWGFSVGVPVKNALLSDSFSHFFIYKHLVADLVKDGVVPLWNKFSLGGTPLLATYHINPFFPANMLLLLPKFVGWNLFIFLATLTSCLSMYLFLNTKISNTLVKVVASLVYGFAGPMTTWSEFGTAVWAAAIIPLVLYSLDEIVIFRKKTGYFLLSIFITLLLFAGHLQLDTYVMVLVPIYTFYSIWTQESKNRLRLLLTILFFALLGLGISLVEILPVYDLFLRSIRGEENYAQSFHYGLVHFSQLIRLYVPDFFGNPSTGNQWGDYIYHEYTSFIGTLSLPFILSGFFSAKKKPYQKIFEAVFLGSLFLVTLNPISNYIFSLPLPLLTFSSASRIFFITGLSSAVLVASGLEQYLVDLRFRKVTSFFCFILLFLIGLALFSSPANHLAVASKNSIVPIILLFCLLAVSFTSLSKIVLAIFIFLIFALDMGRYYRKYNPFVGENLVFPLTPVISFLKEQPGVYRIARENTNLFPPNTWAYYKLESVEGYEPLRPLNYNRLFHLFENNLYLSKAGRYSELEDIDPKFLSLMNVRYFPTLTSSLKKKKVIAKLLDYGFYPVFVDKSVTVLKNPHANERAFFVDNLIKVNSETELAAALENKAFDPLTTAIVTNDVPVIGKDKMRSLDLLLHDDNLVKIQTKSNSDQFVVLSDTFDPGWNITIDGVPSNLYQVDGAIRGFLVPKGIHQVVLEYKPHLFIIGLKASLVSLLLLFSLFIYHLYERRPSTKF